MTLKVALQLWYSTVASDGHETINIMMTEDAVAIPALLRSYPRNDTTASFPKGCIGVLDCSYNRLSKDEGGVKPGRPSAFTFGDLPDNVH